MNGLANAILTLLLSWLRIIVNRVWSMVNSETGSRFFAYLADNWLTILLILGAGGFLLDKLIYLIRWRPFSVRRRRKQLAYDEDYEPEPSWQPPYDQSAYAPPAAYSPAYAAPGASQETDRVYDDGLSAQVYWGGQPNDTTGSPAVDQTAVYNRSAVDHSAYRPPMEDIEPVFDDQALWANSDELVSDPAFLQPTGYPDAQVSTQYVQDMHAGYARPVPPEQLYAPAQQPEPASGGQPVHPGLDAALLRQNMGLGNGEQAYDDSYAVYDDQPVSSFTPFTQQAEAEQPAKKSRNPFLNLMRLVGDEAARPSIHDLHSNVDVREAFREPVYPKPLYRNEDDPT